MALSATYSVGTVDVAANGLTVAGAGTMWVSAGVRAGDIFATNGLSVSIQDVTSSSEITLSEPWPGAALSGAAYEVRYTPDASRVLAMSRSVLESLEKADLAANVRKNNFTASRAPLPTDDATQGYAEGSRWLWQGQEWVYALVGGALRWLPLTESLTPENFGAAGNGSVDDTSAVITWASSTGRLRVTDGAVYRLTAPVTVSAKRIDATGGVFLFDPPAPTEHVMFTLVTPGARWTGGEIDGNSKARGGIDSAAGRIRIREVEAHGFRSLTGRADGIRLTGHAGGEVIDCEVYNVWALGNSNPGDGTGPARGIMISHNTALSAPYRVTGNLIYDIWGEEGDGIHMLLFGGTYPFLDSAGSEFRDNRVYGCGRRCIKIQATGLYCTNNDLWMDGGTPPAGQSSIPRLATLGVVIASDVTISGNRVRCSADCPGISVDYGGYDGACNGLIITDNDVSGGGQLGVYLNGLENSFLGTNRFRSVSQPVAIGRTKRSFVDLQIIIGSAVNGGIGDITVQSDCSHIVVARSLGLSGKRYALVDMRAPKSLVLDTFNMRDSGGVAVMSSAAAVDTIIEGVISATDVAGNAVSVNEAATELGSVRNMGTSGSGFGNGRGGRLFWASGIPTTTRASRKHYRGDIAMNDGTGPEIGWRCSATGVPGTWVAFS